MPELALIQDKIFQSLISTKIDNLDFIKQYNDIDPKERLLIYHRNIFENFINNLKISYPGVWKLLGEECARGVALAYSHEVSNIPSRGKIDEFGVNFPKFLKTFPSTCDLTYLPDFAKLEWLRNISFDAEIELTYNPEDLFHINLNESANCKFIFDSSVFFMQADFPLAQIQDLLDHENDECLDLNREVCYILVYRLNNKVYTSWLDKAYWYFLSSLSEGKTLIESFDICESMSLELKLEEIFNFVFLRKLLLRIC